MATVYTIGYGGRKPQDFVALLQQQRVPRVIDVRLRPDRASMGSYVKARSPEQGIERLLGEQGIAYTSLLELGNVFFHLPDWPQRYEQLLAVADELLLARLLEITPPYALLCAEKRHEECHRTMIATRLRALKGYEIVHLQ